MKNNKFLILLIVAAAAILIAQFTIHGDPKGSTQHTGTSMQKESKVAPNTVQIKGYAFGPDKLTIKKGTTITWENFDIAPHTVTVDEKGKKGPESKLFGKGEKFTYTFTEAGTYAYHCEPHPYMKAVVEVTE